MKYWYVIHTHSHQEFRAELNLKNQGYSVYLPRYSGIRSHARKIEKIVKPLFPRYLFINLDLSLEAISYINSTFGVLFNLGYMLVIIFVFEVVFGIIIILNFIYRIVFSSFS